MVYGSGKLARRSHQRFAERGSHAPSCPAQRIVERFEEEYGLEKLPYIKRDLNPNGRLSPFYRDSHNLYNELKGISEATLNRYAKGE